jgi:hypothetical protein
MRTLSAMKRCTFPACSITSCFRRAEMISRSISAASNSSPAAHAYQHKHPPTHAQTTARTKPLLDRVEI